MAQWFETSVTYTKRMEDSSEKRVTEKYLFDVLSFTEAEARTTEERKPYISGDFVVKACKCTNIAEIFWCDGADKNYLAKVAFIEIDERTGAEKVHTQQILVQANNFKHAYDNFIGGMRGTMADYELLSLAETPILEVYEAKIS